MVAKHLGCAVLENFLDRGSPRTRMHSLFKGDGRAECQFRVLGMNGGVGGASAGGRICSSQSHHRIFIELAPLCCLTLLQVLFGDLSGDKVRRQSL